MKFFPRLLVRLTGKSNGVAVAGYTLMKQMYEVLTSGMGDKVDESVSVERYQDLKKTFTDDLRIRWHNYIRTVQILWGICFTVIFWSLLEQAWLTLFQGFVMLGFVWICLGYRIWVLRERKYPPFFQYLKQVRGSVKSALPINTAHLMD